MVSRRVAHSGYPAGLGLLVEFLNTLDLRRYGDSPYPLERDVLSSREALREWLVSMHLPASDTVSEDDVDLFRRFREGLREVVAGNRGRRGGSEVTASVPLYLEFSSDGMPILDARSGGVAGAIGKMVGEIHAAGANGTWARLKVCASEDCRKVFYDSSRNRMGRWCSMERCGNRAKTRAYRRRRSDVTSVFAAADAPPGTVSPAPRRRRSNVFRREGEYWSISFGGATFRLKDAKGLHYMARLLREPGREWHVLDMVGVEENLAVESTTKRLVGNDARMGPVGGAYEPVLDARARAAYERRLEDLREQLNDAEEWGDPERGARARQEIEAISDELARATGLRGRDRTVASDAERARVNVTRVIKAALTRIDSYCPELRHHFASTLKTGLYCSYNPDPRLPPSWQL